MKLSDLVDQFDLPETDVAEGAWDAARRRTRRRRILVVGASAALVLVVVGASVLSLRGDSGQPQPTGPEPTPAITTPTEVAAPKGIDHSNTQQLLTPDFWAGLDAPLLNPGSTTDLSDDPMTEGVFATVDPDDPTVPLVLASDGRWRRVSVPDLVPIEDGDGYTSPVVRPTAISADGTRLALPQPDSLVVVDLTDGSHRTYPMPGDFLSYAVWVDSDHVLVASEGAPTGSVIDLDTGETNPSEFGPQTAFADGDSLAWGRNDVSLKWGTRPAVPTLANNGGGLVEHPPLFKDGIAVGDMSVGSRKVGSEDPPLGYGVVAVDATTGDVLAYLPTGPAPGFAVLLGWQGDLPILGLMDHTGENQTMVIAAWDYQAARLEPLAQTPRSVGTAVAWNGAID